MRFFISFTFLSCLSILGALCALPARAESLTVAVAANVQYAFDDLRTAFTQQSAISIKPLYASSGKLTAQIQNGAPFDLFVSADMEYPEALQRAGLASSAPKIYAYGVLVLWSMQSLDLSKGIAVLADNSIRKVALPNPQVAPYGREALRALQSSKLAERVMPKLVYGESIGQASQYIFSGVVDAGFTAKSVVLSPEMQGKGRWVEVEARLYTPIAQGAVILKHGQTAHPKAAQLFLDFLFSKTARTIFTRYGYRLP
jgi:molybdate transport system substrate-binding protein